MTWSCSRLEQGYNPSHDPLCGLARVSCGEAVQGYNPSQDWPCRLTKCPIKPLYTRAAPITPLLHQVPLNRVIRVFSMHSKTPSKVMCCGREDHT